MSLEVNVDTYVSVEEADKLIENYFISTNEVRTGWEELSASDKESLLRHSCRAIDSLRLDGKKKYPGQKLQFPRIKGTLVGVAWRPYVCQYSDNSLISGGSADGGLEEAKLAQALNSAYMAYFDGASLENMSNNIRGLTSEKTDVIQKSYGNPQNNTYNRDAQKGIYTKEVYSILIDWCSESRLGW